jgi:hypothetical protein
MNKKFIAENYKRMSDEELLSIFSNDMKDLTEDAQEVLKEELQSRNLGEGIDALINSGGINLSTEKFNEYAKFIRELPCPVCASTESKLNAVLILTNRYEDFTIACPTCLSKVIYDAQANSLGFGLLGGIKGTINAVSQIGALQSLIRQVEKNEPTEAMRAFIKKRMGEIELYKNDQDKLKNLVKYPNAVLY